MYITYENHHYFIKIRFAGWTNIKRGWTVEKDKTRKKKKGVMGESKGKHNILKTHFEIYQH